MGTSFDDDSEMLKAEKKSLQDQVSKMEQQLLTKENQISMKERQLVSKDREIGSLKSDMQKMTVRANQAERKVLELQGKPKVCSFIDKKIVLVNFVIHIYFTVK